MKPTENQLRLIQEIEEYSVYPIKFRGTTKEEAAAWINENLHSVYINEWAVANGYD